MSAILSKASRAVLDLVFPLNCTVCHRDGRLLCQGCESALPRLEKPYCAICATPGTPALCESCATAPPAIDGTRVPFTLDGAIRDMVYGLKYRNLRAAAEDLGRLLAAHLESNPVPADVMMPVPLHKRRERERGYNQSELLARALGKGTAVPVETRALVRTRNTPPQVAIGSQEERRRNVEGAFECTATVAGSMIVLIDDVVTTGSTLFACAAALKAAGASSVWGLALARQS